MEARIKTEKTVRIKLSMEEAVMLREALHILLEQGVPLKYGTVLDDTFLANFTGLLCDDFLRG